ncbi:MAG: helix-turn-helix domain-containing protein [Gammaproteobacteria bacterium]|nr:helix-turn-helix domain-containing protein [Gammaproteobacteria bacterium]
MNTHVLAKQTLLHWKMLEPYAALPRNEQEYQKQIAFLNVLMESAIRNKNSHISSLLILVASHIDVYERKKHLAQRTTPIEVLQHLMEEHGLKQSELPEIGSQSLVSKILSGERHLTIEQVKCLAKRFGVSPAVFC